jgi:hypothetical protein
VVGDRERGSGGEAVRISEIAGKKRIFSLLYWELFRLCGGCRSRGICRVDNETAQPDNLSVMNDTAQ